jgi:Icc-related predicted phosphoesterase
VALKAKKMKVITNEGNNDHKLPQVSFDNAAMIPNLENIGISFGNIEGSTSQGWSELNRILHSCSGVANNLDKRRDILNLEEKELADEEVDRLVLQNICGEIMEEIMDVGVDNFVIPTKLHDPGS